MNYIDANKLRQIFFIIILLLLAFVLFSELRNFVPAFLGAVTFYVVMRKWMFRMVYVRKFKPGLAAFILMITSFIVIMVPVWMVVNLLSPKISLAIANSSEVIKRINEIAQDIGNRTGFKLVSENNLSF